MQKEQKLDAADVQFEYRFCSGSTSKQGKRSTETNAQEKRKERIHLNIRK